MGGVHYRVGMHPRFGRRGYGLGRAYTIGLVCDHALASVATVGSACAIGFVSVRSCDGVRDHALASVVTGSGLMLHGAMGSVSRWFPSICRSGFRTSVEGPLFIRRSLVLQSIQLRLGFSAVDRLGGFRCGGSIIVVAACDA